MLVNIPNTSTCILTFEFNRFKPNYILCYISAVIGVATGVIIGLVVVFIIVCVMIDRRRGIEKNQQERFGLYQ